MIRSPTLALLSAIGLLAMGGCGGRSAPAADETTSAERIRELREQRRRDQTRMRHLEAKMAVLARDKRDVAMTPELPVERVAPPPSLEAAGDDPDDPSNEPAGVIVGIAEDGTEIVYVGEAAQSGSIAADTRMLDDGVPAPRRVDRIDDDVVSLPLPTAGRDLGVTPGRLPRVGEVTKSLPPAPRAREATSPRRPGSASAAAISEYQAQVAALKAGKHEEAIRGLRRFVRRYGRSDYADNAQYWLGEAFYDRKLYEQALAEFEKVALAYPTGNKVPDARLKAAFCKISLSDNEGARALLSEIIAEYPGSQVAQLATEKLEHLSE